MGATFKKDKQYYKFCAYGFLKNLRFFDAFIILFFVDKGMSFLQIGILYSFKEITINILEMPTGVIADSFGRRRSMIFSFGGFHSWYLKLNIRSWLAMIISDDFLTEQYRFLACDIESFHR